MVFSFLWENVYATRYELAVALIFVVGWSLGKSRARNKPRSLYKVAFKPDVEPKHRPPRQSKMSKPTEGDVAPFEGPIECIDPGLLTDISWTVPQVVRLLGSDQKNSSLAQATQLYRAAIKAGLKLHEVPAAQLRPLCMLMVQTAIRAGEMEHVNMLFDDMRKADLTVEESLFTSTVKMCTSKQMFAESLAIYDCVSKDPAFVLKEQTAWSCLLFSATEEKLPQKCVLFFENVKKRGTPLSKDFGNMLRIIALAGDWKACLSILDKMAQSKVEIDSVQYNMTLAACVAAGRTAEARTLLEKVEGLGGVADVITYNTIMKGLAKEGRIEECYEMFERLKEKGMNPSQVTYGILLDGCINENQLDRALKVFDEVDKSGMPLNTILYTLLIKGFARAGDCSQAMNVYSRMQLDRNVSPDLITFSILIKANCDADRMDDALVLVGDMIRLGLKPDEVVFNSLIAGCAKQGNAKLGKQLLADMVASGVRPSNATFSILIRLYQYGKCLEDAVTMLKEDPAKYNVVPEPRLYSQLIQSCIRERQGRRAIEVYDILVNNSEPTQATHSGILSTCVKLHMYDTAAEIIQMAVAHGKLVSERDTNSVLEAAFKKGKSQIMRSCVASMTTLGHHIDPKFL